MNKELPKIYKGSDCSKIKNNKSFFCSSDPFDDFDRITKNAQNIDFEFNTPVTIKTKDKVIYAKIVSKIGDHILTSNNEIIKLEDIQSIN